MNSSRGQPTRKRPQKHQNSVAWKNDKFKTDPTTKLLTKIVITNCCPKCTGVIEWKVKYAIFTLKQLPICQFTKRLHPVLLKFWIILVNQIWLQPVSWRKITCAWSKNWFNLQISYFISTNYAELVAQNTSKSDWLRG